MISDFFLFIIVLGEAERRILSRFTTEEKRGAERGEKGRGERGEGERRGRETGAS